MNYTILIIEDEESSRFAYSKYLENEGFQTDPVGSLSSAREKMSEKNYDIFIMDMVLPDGNILDIIPSIRKKCPHSIIVVVTAFGSIDQAVKAMHLGANHFLTKPVNLEKLTNFIKKKLKQSSALAKESEDQIYFGQSNTMRNIKKLARLAAIKDTNVLLLGDTGVGKGVLAHWIHRNSPHRSDGEFVEINCSGLKGELLASELFGHKKGAFTSAVSEKKGLIREADGGTLFLDEIGDMSFELQAEFLKVLEDKQFRRLGDVKMIKSDFRLICATNTDLSDKVENKEFRKDLYYRIKVFPIYIPPLRERTEDLPELAEIALQNLGETDKQIAPETWEVLNSYHWPGNIREFFHMIERAVLLCEKTVLKPEHFEGLNIAGSKIPLDHDSLENVEKQHIESIMEQYQGDTEKAAKTLGISRASLYRKLKKH
jgi:two-component system NtrC family response regulator